ncbi:hypothetical protein BDB01DRAFT_797694, partial [Pilobolus umbonatus]
MTGEYRYITKHVNPNILLPPERFYILFWIFNLQSPKISIPHCIVYINIHSHP